MLNFDLVFCIDGTWSMLGYIDDVRETVLRITEELEKSPGVDNIRSRLILFRDYLADGPEDAMLHSDFMVMPGEKRVFKELLDNISPSGGGDDAEDALEALAEAMRSNWRSGARHVIFLFTDDDTKLLGTADKLGLSYYPETMPKSFSVLENMWGSLTAPGIVGEDRLLLLFTPETENWNCFRDFGRTVRCRSTEGFEKPGEKEYAEILKCLLAEREYSGGRTEKGSSGKSIATAGAVQEGGKINVDIVLVIDSASRMARHLDRVRNQAMGFVRDIRKGFCERGYDPELRVKSVDFGSYVPGDGLVVHQSRFFRLPYEEQLLSERLSKIRPYSMDSGPGNGLEAIDKAMCSDWSRGVNRRQVIIVWSDAGCRELASRHDTNSYEALKKAWVGPPARLMKKKSKRLVMLAPIDKNPEYNYWKTIVDQWDNSALYPSHAGLELKDSYYRKLLDFIIKEPGEA